MKQGRSGMVTLEGHVLILGELYRLPV